MCWSCGRIANAATGTSTRHPRTCLSARTSAPGAGTARRTSSTGSARTAAASSSDAPSARPTCSPSTRHRPSGLSGQGASRHPPADSAPTAPTRLRPKSGRLGRWDLPLTIGDRPTVSLIPSLIHVGLPASITGCYWALSRAYGSTWSVLDGNPSSCKAAGRRFDPAPDHGSDLRRCPVFLGVHDSNVVVRQRRTVSSKRRPRLMRSSRVVTAGPRAGSCSRRAPRRFRRARNARAVQRWPARGFCR